MKFANPYEPTQDELPLWSRKGSNAQPTEDFDLLVSREENRDFILEMAADSTHRKTHFFLRCLYFLVGDAVRSRFVTTSESNLQALFDRAENLDSPGILLWLAQARALLEEPQTFDYQDWCDGRLSRQNFKKLDSK